MLKKNIIKSSVVSFGFILSLFFATGVVAAETKIGVVNSARLLKEAPQAEAAKKKLKAEFAPRDEKIVSMQQKLKKLEDELTKNASVMSEPVRKKKERKLISDKRDIKRAKEEFNEDFNLRRNEELSKLQKMIYNAIITLAKNESYDIILGDSVLYTSQQTDLTDKVLERLRQNFKSTSVTNNQQNNN